MFEQLKRRPIESYNKVWLGTIALVVIVVVLAAAVMFGRLNIGKLRYHAEFAQAAQMKSGDQVTIAGIHVGTVDGVKLVGDHVTISFNVRKDVHLGSATAAAIKLTTILGSRYLELRPAGTDDLDNATIPLANTQVPYDLQRTLAGATNTFEPVDAGRIVESVKILNESLEGLPEALPQALDNLQSLAAIMADRRNQIGSLLSNTDTLTTMLRDQRADLGVLILQGRDVMREVATRRAAVERLFRGTTTLVDRVKAVMEDEPALNQFLADTREFTKLMAEHDALLRSTLQAAPLSMRNLANITGSGNAIDVVAPMPLGDSMMCAISGRAKQFNLVEYFKDCE